MNKPRVPTYETELYTQLINRAAALCHQAERIEVKIVWGGEPASLQQIAAEIEQAHGAPQATVREHLAARAAS
ncbi:MAG TPA: hypothetical protein PLW65_34215 [Pseudomonadota bacterium]|nr:hypothetical protein [Pseudomonadota bacterium]